ncbi:uncharacterized protein N7518_000700 [Penicillium psychrosexuale]|uniref:uncharacterized protein n=1 Tax=Penicillium psychrosexuale TaxID=1002107 RepID=UPI0025450E7B|nr:uncharacterized protein N7518_000700 [Penicillium psychrosexuale]KAJ5804397.1 hypothetical protein N7518_000700 [Penicillium psychrosexuale]
MSRDTHLPSNETQWNQWAVTHEVSNSTIHDAILTSASTISEKQYLLLQVLWTKNKGQNIDLEHYELEKWKIKADKLLATFKSWTDYRASFQSGPILQGTFALARMYQTRAAVSTDETFQSNVAISPIANRTRSKAGESKMSDLTQRLQQLPYPQTPSKSTGTLPDYSDDEETPDTRDGDTPFYSAGPKEIAYLMYPRTKDEQIVNTALVDFLNALSMHFPQASNWTLHRKSFKAVFEHASFEARTDGYLEDTGSGRVRALIEVKPMLRRKKLNPIRMQESAQMVAWIKSDPDHTGALNLPGHRLHVSQDRHQIFITFAEYADSYIQYLNDMLPEKSPRPFLTMHEFGPWNTTSRRDMEAVGGILLAIALRAYSDAEKSG